MAVLTTVDGSRLQVLEVVAETEAPRREIELLLADQPSEAAQADRAATAAAIADAEQMVGCHLSPIPACYIRRMLLCCSTCVFGRFVRRRHQGSLVMATSLCDIGCVRGGAEDQPKLGWVHSRQII